MCLSILQCAVIGYGLADHSYPAHAVLHQKNDANVRPEYKGAALNLENIILGQISQQEMKIFNIPPIFEILNENW